VFTNPWQRHKDLLSIHDLTAGEVEALFQLAANVKARPDRYRAALAGRTLAMIFEKQSTRTRVSFEVGMYQLGGLATFLSSRDIQIGRGETVHYTARVLSRYVDGIMARTFAHETVTELARWAEVPVINGLTDLLHPCQALADYFTLRERFGHTRGLTMAYVGDGNNVCHSLMFGGPKAGAHVRVVTPEGYRPRPEIVEAARQDATEAGTTIELFDRPEEAVPAQWSTPMCGRRWAGGRGAGPRPRVRRLPGDAGLISAPTRGGIHALPALPSRGGSRRRRRGRCALGGLRQETETACTSESGPADAAQPLKRRPISASPGITVSAINCGSVGCGGGRRRAAGTP
jgi:ornithine carbamoyltransferase